MRPLGLILLLWAAQASASPHPAAEAVRAFRRSPAEAAEALTVAMATSPDVADALRLLRGEAHLAAGRSGAALADAKSLFEAAPPWRRRVAWLVARAVTRKADCALADAALAVVRVDHRHVTQAALRAERGRLARLCKGPKAWAAWAQRQAVEDPQPGPAPAALGTEARFARAARFEARRDYAAAREALGALAVEGPSGDRARFELARLSLDRTRDDFEGAARDFASLAEREGPYQVPAAYQRARALGRAGRFDDAIAAYEALVARWPTAAEAADANFFGAFLRYESGDYAEAAARFGAITTGKWGAASRWYHAWCTYLAGGPEAPALMDALATGARADDAVGRRALYWSVRLLADRRPVLAATRAVSLVEAAPFDWYSVLLRRRYPGIFAPIAAPAPSPAPALPEGVQARVARLDALVTLGLADFAAAEMPTLVPALTAAGVASPWLRLAEHAAAPNAGMAAAQRAHGAALQRPSPDDPPTLRRARRAAWPTGFEADVRRAGARFGVQPALIWAFIRKESAFRPGVVSKAHAIGLMQMLARTAAQVRAQGGLVDVGTNLFDPSTNITHGAWYVSALQRRFEGQLPLVAAGYNAGPGAVDAWVRAPAEATDRFVERIPFREARIYVRRLVTTFLFYRVLHDGLTLDQAAAQVPLTLDLTRHPGVDF